MINSIAGDSAAIKPAGDYKGVFRTMEIFDKLSIMEGKIRRHINKPKFEKEILVLETESIYSSLENIIFKVIQCRACDYATLRRRLEVFPEEYVKEALEIFQTEGIIANENGKIQVTTAVLKIAELFKNGKTNLTSEEDPTGKIRIMMENFRGIEKIAIYGDERA